MIIGALGSVTKNIRKLLERLEIKGRRDSMKYAAKICSKTVQILGVLKRLVVT